MNVPKGNGWSEWQNHVLAELTRLSNSVDKLHESFNAHKEKNAASISALKVKASLWGGLAGGIPVAIAIIWYIMSQQ